MGSSRLPGKVMMDLGGQPMLGFMLERLAALGTPVVVATSDLSGDDPIAELALERSVAVVRGSESDVLERYRLALELHPADHVIRLTADCPLMDPMIVRDVVSLHRAKEADYTSNVFPRTFPKGLDVEVMRSTALQLAANESVDPAEREHVTPFFYRHPERFRLANLRSGELLGDQRWTVDTPEDLSVLRSMIDQMAVRLEPTPPVGLPLPWRDVLSRVGITAGASNSLRLRPADEQDAAAVLAWRNDPESVRSSASASRVSSADHSLWWDRVIDDPSVILMIGAQNGERVGMVRADIADATGVVSIAVDPERRGRGVGRELLRQFADLVAGGFQIDRLVADIRPHNLASRSIFERAGFARTGSDHGLDRFQWVTPRLRQAPS